jgi:hypothetical protein
MSLQPRDFVALYRQILRVHKVKLPGPLRGMGDSVVRDEFHKHKSAAPKYLPAFYQEWKQYLDMMAGRVDDMSPGVSGELSPDTLKAMSPEQKLQLEKIRSSIEKLK